MKFAVQLTATLDKIDSVKPVDTPDSVFEYTFKIQCTSLSGSPSKEHHHQPSGMYSQYNRAKTDTYKKKKPTIY